jgi:hypothetical protein
MVDRKRSVFIITMTSTFVSTSSAAVDAWRVLSPSAQRDESCGPAVDQPSSRSRSSKLATIGLHAAGEAAPGMAMVLPGACARRERPCACA